MAIMSPSYQARSIWVCVGGEYFFFFSLMELKICALCFSNNNKKNAISTIWLTLLLHCIICRLHLIWEDEKRNSHLERKGGKKGENVIFVSSSVPLIVVLDVPMARAHDRFDIFLLQYDGDASASGRTRQPQEFIPSLFVQWKGEQRKRDKQLPTKRCRETRERESHPCD